MRRTSAILLGLVLGLVATLAGCSDSKDQKPSSQPPSTAKPTKPISLSLLVFNVEYGGSKSTDAVMADLDADVVGVLESYNRLPEIAKAAGYPYYDVGLQILSKYPILEPSGADGLYAYIEVRPGEAVAMVNTHLDYVQDGPNRLERGVPVADVLATEKKVRLSSIDTLLPSVNEPAGQGVASHVHRRPQRAVAPTTAPLPGRSARRWLERGCTTPTGRRTRTSLRARATPGVGSRAARAVPGGSTTPTSADRSRSGAARSSVSKVATASTAATRSGPPTTVRCCHS